MDKKKLQANVESLHEAVNNGQYQELEKKREQVDQVIHALDTGAIRVAECCDGFWKTNEWVKKAILLYFRCQKMTEITVGPFLYRDKIPLKKNFADLQVRVVPPATARYGSYMEPGVVLMPSYINIGAYVGRRTMVDTWATVGSCAQIGANVHLSGGVGIGGVLEPPSARPVVIEDGAFLGSRSIVVEGVCVRKEAVLAANVTITASTPIIDTRTASHNILKGEIPERSVVVPGVREKNVSGGKIYTACVYIIGERQPSTDLKTSLNAVLRDFSISV